MVPKGPLLYFLYFVLNARQESKSNSSVDIFWKLHGDGVNDLIKYFQLANPWGTTDLRPEIFFWCQMDEDYNKLVPLRPICHSNSHKQCFYFLFDLARPLCQTSTSAPFLHFELYLSEIISLRFHLSKRLSLTQTVGFVLYSSSLLIANTSKNWCGRSRFTSCYAGCLLTSN